jgi:integrase
VWTIPAKRMKTGKEHRVPLSSRVVEIVKSMKELAGQDIPADAFVFPRTRRGRPLSNMAFLMLLRRVRRDI